MADFVKMIPFILHFAAGVPSEAKNMEIHQQFELARKRGWSNDPDDPGGATMIDITYSTFCYHRQQKGMSRPSITELREIKFEEWQEILKNHFWNRLKADSIISQGLANMCVDWLWASGSVAVRNIQKILGVEADGIVGPRTLAKLNGDDVEALFERIRDAREKHYRSCRGAWKYLNGWLRRLNAIRPDGSFRY